MAFLICEQGDREALARSGTPARKSRMAVMRALGLCGASKGPYWACWGLEARSFRGEIAAVPLWKVIVGATAGKLVNRTPMGPVFFISGAGGDARLHATEMPLKFLSQSGGQGKHMAWTTPILVEICIGLEINGYLPAEF